MKEGEMRSRKKELVGHPRVRELLARDRSGTISGKEAQELLRLQFLGREESARRRKATKDARKNGSEAPKRKLPDTVSDAQLSAERQARIRKEIVERRLKEQYKTDERREIMDENGDMVPNPRFGELLDS